jgi:hypothetical protein
VESDVTTGVIASALGRGKEIQGRHVTEDASLETLRVVVAGLTIPLGTGLLLAMSLAGPRWVADFSHRLGFLFGGAIEGMYVFSERDAGRESDTRSIPKHIGR